MATEPNAVAFGHGTDGCHWPGLTKREYIFFRLVSCMAPTYDGTHGQLMNYCHKLAELAILRLNGDVCPTCKGRGIITSKCESCDGKGGVRHDPCRDCGGDGKRTTQCETCNGLCFVTGNPVEASNG